MRGEDEGGGGRGGGKGGIWFIIWSTYRLNCLMIVLYQM